MIATQATFPAIPPLEDDNGLNRFRVELQTWARALLPEHITLGVFWTSFLSAYDFQLAHTSPLPDGDGCFSSFKVSQQDLFTARSPADVVEFKVARTVGELDEFWKCERELRLEAQAKGGGA